MTDTVTAPVRSRMMSNIRGKNTKPEIVLRKALHARGFRFRLHRTDLPGKPDLVFSKHHAVCFVHGYFWHRHPDCRFSTSPATRSDFWQTKFKQNVERDRRTLDTYLQLDWRVAVIWECQLRKEVIATTVAILEMWLLDGCSSIKFLD